MQEIQLTKGYVAIIDDVDYPLVSQYKWHVNIQPTVLYAANWRLRTTMHLLIMKPGLNLVVNHIDKDGLNNTRDNLEIITQAENVRLARRRRDSTMKYKGVYQRPSGKFYAEIKVNYRKHYLGLFNSEIEAAQAYNNAGERLFGKGKFMMNEVDLDELQRAIKS